MDKINRQIYIASPLFNEKQIARIQFVEGVCEKYGVPYFSPRLHGEPFVDSIEGRNRTYQSDVKGLEASGLVLANLDWDMEDEKITCVARIKKGFRLFNAALTGDVWEVLSEDLNVPDPGTVWEMGHADGKGIPVVGYALKRTPLMNIMITESANGILKAEEKIEEFVKLWSKVETWEDRARLLGSMRMLYKWSGTTQ